MIREKVSFGDIPKDSNYHKMMDGLRDDRLSICDLEKYLDSSDVEVYKLYIEDTYIGFYSLENGPVKEAHAYVLPDKRRYSVEVLRFITRETPKPFLTSVYGSHMHVYKLLKRMGFVDYYSIPSFVLKDNNLYDIFYLVKRSS